MGGEGERGEKGEGGEEAIATHELIQRRYGAGRAAFLRTDVRVEGDVRGCVEEVVRGGGRLDL